MKHTGYLLLVSLLTTFPLSAQDPMPVPGQLSGPVSRGVYDIDRSGSDLFAVAEDVVLRSDDLGESWEKLPPPPPPGRMSEIEVTADGDIWVVTDLGLYSRPIGSNEWLTVREGEHRSLAITTDGSIFIIDREEDDVYRSEDEGSTWQLLPTSGESFQQVIPADDETVWALSDAAVELSLDNGTSWSSRGLVSTPTSLFHLLLLGSEDVLLITSDKVYRSGVEQPEWEEIGPSPDSRAVAAAIELPDGRIVLGYESDQNSTPALYRTIGTTNEWENLQVTDLLDADLTPRVFVVAEGGRLVMGTSYTDRQWGEPGIDIGQIMVSDDSGENWEVRFSTSFAGSYLLKTAVLSEETIVAVRYPPAFPGEESHLIYRTDNGGRDWEEITPRDGDVRYSTYSIMSNGTLFMTRADTALFWSVDTGRSWGPVPTPPAAWIPAGEVIEVDSETLIVESRVGFDATKIFASTDGGESWSQRGTRTIMGGVIAWAIDRSGVIYLAENNAVSVSFDTGSTWSSVSVGGSSGNYITDIAISSEGKPIVATFLRKLYTSHNSGASWEEVGGSPGNQLSEMVLDAAGNLYIGSRSGSVFRSKDNGETWEPFTEIPEPTTAIRSLSIGAGDFLYISTELRGLWRVSTTGASDVPNRKLPLILNLH